MAPRSSKNSAPEAPEAVVARQNSAQDIVVNNKPLKYTRTEVRNHIAKYAEPDSDLVGLFYVGSTFIAWLGSLFLPLWTTPITIGLAMRLFVVGVHDTGHRALFKNQALNTIVGTICGPCIFTPFAYWRSGHDYHHNHSNDLDHHQFSQSAPITLNEYKSWSKWMQLAYRVFTFPYIMVSVTFPFVMVVLQPLQATKILDAVIQASYFYLAYQYGVLPKFVLSMLGIAVIGVFLFHLQHTFEECKREHQRDYFANGYFGSSFLHVPEALKFFFAGIEYHHIHHINARVPFYKLRQCHEEAPEGMWEGIKHITFAEGWDTLNLALYDEEKDKLVRFSEVDADQKKKQ